MSITRIGELTPGGLSRSLATGGSNRFPPVSSTSTVVMRGSARGRRWLEQLLHTHDTPERTAAAYAVGVFFGFSPFLGLHTVLGLVVAFTCKILNFSVGRFTCWVYSDLRGFFRRFCALATTRPSTVCSPSNGENPKNTPSAYAAAVRCGVSCVWSSWSSQRRRRGTGDDRSEVNEPGGQRFEPAAAHEHDVRSLVSSPMRVIGTPRAWRNDRREAPRGAPGHGEQQLVVVAARAALARPASIARSR